MEGSVAEVSRVLCNTAGLVRFQLHNASQTFVFLPLST